MYLSVWVSSVQSSETSPTLRMSQNTHTQTFSKHTLKGTLTKIASEASLSREKIQPRLGMAPRGRRHTKQKKMPLSFGATNGQLYHESQPTLLAFQHSSTGVSIRRHTSSYVRCFPECALEKHIASACHLEHLTPSK